MAKLTAKSLNVKVPRVKTPKHYYSIYFADQDVNYANEIEVMKHDNNPDMTAETIDSMANHFSTHAKAVAAKKAVEAALGVGVGL